MATDDSIGRESDKFMLRLPDGMRERIAEAARDNKRSMNAQVVAMIEYAFEHPAHEYLQKLGRERQDEQQIELELTRLVTQRSAVAAEISQGLFLCSSLDQKIAEVEADGGDATTFRKKRITASRQLVELTAESQALKGRILALTTKKARDVAQGSLSLDTTMGGPVEVMRDLVSESEAAPKGRADKKQPAKRASK